MNKPPREKRLALIVAIVVGLAVSAGMLSAVVAVSPLGKAFPLEDTAGNAARMGGLIGQLRDNLRQAALSEKCAVLAETPEEARPFIDEVVQASARAEQTRRELASLTAKTGREAELVARLGEAWEGYRKIDADLLVLAAQKTNTQAARLSSGQAAEAIAHMDRALSGPASPLAAKLLLPTLRIHALLAQHIAAHSDTDKETIEEAIATLHAEAKAALVELEAVLGSDNRIVADVGEAYADFARTTADIVTLSRQNSNNRSQDLSLGEKRAAQARLENGLTALEDAVRGWSPRPR